MVTEPKPKVVIEVYRPWRWWGMWRWRVRWYGVKLESSMRYWLPIGAKRAADEFIEALVAAGFDVEVRDA